MSVATYTKTGNKATAPLKLDKKIFGMTAFNHQLLKDVYLAYLANGRDNFAVTKSRGEVRGGGAKPWRQKGTGRARAGSNRSPLWRGGGVTFGPTGQQNYKHKVNAKTKKEALRQALSLATTENRIKIIESFVSAEGKIKPTINLLKKIDAGGSVLLVISEKNEFNRRATDNLPNLEVVQAKYLHVYHLLNADNVVIERPALEIIQDWLSSHVLSTVARSKGSVDE